MSLFEDIIKTVEVAAPAPDVDKREFLVGLVRVISACPDNQWNALSLDAQKWFNEAGPAINGMKPIPVLEGFTDVEQPSKEAKAAKGKGIPQIRKTGRRRNATGVLEVIRRTIIQHPDWSARLVHEHVKSNGFPDVNIETINVNTSDIHKVITLAREMGFWNDAKYEEEEVKIEAEAGEADVPVRQGEDPVDGSKSSTEEKVAS